MKCNSLKSGEQVAYAASNICHTSEQLRSMINPDICLTESQAKLTTSMIERSFIRDSLHGVTPIDIIQFATYLNSVRLECTNCLNSACPRRDKEVK